ncbi:hypothetical protein [Robbsia andropogonis]|uniref:hypothetical protein n=1 Tax=Robbsia andropogonis TaxID=28092 RepID=UPI002A6AE1CF|nr:hypothetical protein [Robbsia andropogonis]
MAKHTCLEQIVSLGLFGGLRQSEGGFLSFERTPLLLSKNEASTARTGRAVWLDEPAGWFATEESDINALAEWMPEYVAPNFLLASNTQSCWKCGCSTPVFSVASKGDYLARLPLCEEDDATTEGVVWTMAESGTFIGNLTLVNGSVRRSLARHCPNYRVDFSKTAESNYFINHCRSCDAKLGDFYMHNEPGGAFFPTTEVQATKIQLRKVEVPLLSQGSASITTPDLLPFCSVID